MIFSRFVLCHKTSFNLQHPVEQLLYQYIHHDSDEGDDYYIHFCVAIVVRIMTILSQ